MTTFTVQRTDNPIEFLIPSLQIEGIDITELPSAKELLKSLIDKLPDNPDEDSSASLLIHQIGSSLVAEVGKITKVQAGICSCCNYVTRITSYDIDL